MKSLNKIIPILVIMCCSLTLMSQSSFTTDEAFLESISNLPTPLVEMVESKVTQLSIDSKEELLTVSDYRKKVTNSTMSVKLHNDLHSWMQQHLSSEEMRKTQVAMAAAMNKNN